MTKVIGRFDPTPSRTPEECERHYTAVHVRMAQDLLRPMDGFRSYHTNRAVAQADVAGGWGQRPRAWRFVILRLVPGQPLAFTPEQLEMIFLDHVNCLYRWRQNEVQERVALDRRHGEHLGLSKVLIEAERAPHSAPGDGAEAFTRLAERVRAAMQDAHGARLLLVNVAVNETLTAPVDVEGQRAVDVSDETTRAGYLECYFDHTRWGREALGPLVAAGGLADPALSEINVLEVEEQTPLDASERPA